MTSAAAVRKKHLPSPSFLPLPPSASRCAVCFCMQRQGVCVYTSSGRRTRSSIIKEQQSVATATCRVHRRRQLHPRKNSSSDGGKEEAAGRTSVSSVTTAIGGPSSVPADAVGAATVILLAAPLQRFGRPSISARG
ncbi:hypothetical protein MTO96_005647 [Rhipicephalus appendiculatus]